MENKLNEAVVYTVMETAKLLKVGRTMMYRLIRSNEIKHIKIGKKILIPSKYIQEYLDFLSKKCYTKVVDNPPCCGKGV